MTTCHGSNDKYLAASEETICKALVKRCLVDGHPGSALDVGAGNSGAGRRILQHWNYTGIDSTLDAGGVDNGDGLGGLLLTRDILDPTYLAELGGKKFDLVLCKRVLCQMSADDVARAIAHISVLVRPGGHLIVCEPWRFQREALAAIRGLPDPESGGRGVDQGPMRTFFGAPIADLAVAPDYVLWTRYLYPLLHGSRAGHPADFLGYDDRARAVFPTFSPGAHRKHAFYRALLWKKTP